MVLVNSLENNAQLKSELEFVGAMTKDELNEGALIEEI